MQKKQKTPKPTNSELKIKQHIKQKRKTKNKQITKFEKTISKKQ